MKGRALQCLGRQEGSALPAVLVLITVISTIVGFIMMGLLLRGKSLQRDADALQARYNAEAAAYLWMAADSLIFADSMAIELPDGTQGIIGSEPFGGYAKVTALGRSGDRESRIQMLVGQRPSRQFEDAIVLGDIQSALHLAGRTKVRGDVLTGPLGLRKAAFKGELFSGAVKGEIILADTTPMPVFDAGYIEGQIDSWNRLLSSPPRNARQLAPGRYQAATFADLPSPAIYYSGGNIEIISRDTTRWDYPVMLISRGSISIDGKIRYARFSRLMAGGSMTLHGSLVGDHGLFYAADSLNVSGPFNGSGQFIAGERLTVSNRSYLRYPSLLYVRGSIEDGIRSGLLRLADQSVVDGTAIVPRPGKMLERDRLKVVIGEGATLRGALYNNGLTELHGQLLGSLQTFQFYMYHSPATYINWVKDATIDIEARPDPFVVPLNFLPGKDYAVVDRWEL